LKQPKPEKDAEAKKKRAKDKKVTFSGSMANPEFQEIFNTVGHEGVAEADKETLNEKPQASDWQTLLQKEKLTPLEMMQEAAFTELINKQSLEQLQMLENENHYNMMKRDRFAPDEVIIKFRQRVSTDGTKPQSQFIFPPGT